MWVQQMNSEREKEPGSHGEVVKERQNTEQTSINNKIIIFYFEIFLERFPLSLDNSAQFC